ncbi:MAG: cyclic-di-AMP receptor [Chloroflexi bacterium]|nr:cyclic-di-AMP receptor [Chloroflexota bacterium]
MKLVIAIVHSEDAGTLVDALTDKDYRVTRLRSSGGFLKQENATVILGVEEEQIEDVIAVIRETCHARNQFINPMPPLMEPGEFYMPYPVEVSFGGATVFVVEVARTERI